MYQAIPASAYRHPAPYNRHTGAVNRHFDLVVGAIRMAGT